MKKIIDILYLEDYKLLLLLNTGQETVVNLASEIERPELESLKEIKTFAKFVLTNGILAWPNGAGFHHDILINMLEENEIEVAA